MNDLSNSKEKAKSKAAGNDVLSARLLYLALKCPLLNEGKYSQTDRQQTVKTPKPKPEDDALVEMRIVLPYGLRRQAQIEHINCSALFRRALKRSLVTRRSLAGKNE